MIWTAADPMPATITASASGTSSPRSTWLPVRPMPRAASVSSGSTSVIPACVLMRIGGIPSAIIAIERRQDLEPELGVDQHGERDRDADQGERRDGAPEVRRVDRDALAAPRVPDPQPDREGDEAGDQQAGQRQRDVLDQAHGDPVRARPVGGVGQPGDGLADDRHAASACGPERLDVGGARPRRRPPLHGDQRQVDDDRQQHRRHRAEQHLGREEVPPALEDEEAEAAEPVADRAGDRHEADRRHARDPEARR